MNVPHSTASNDDTFAEELKRIQEEYERSIKYDPPRCPSCGYCPHCGRSAQPYPRPHRMIYW